MSNKKMYIGAGLHMDPLIHFPETKEFIFVDTQPRSEFDSELRFRDYYYRHNFVDNLKAKCANKGFNLQSEQEIEPNYYNSIMTIGQRLWWFNMVKEMFPHINPTLIIFYNENTNQTLKYYVSTNLKFNGPIEDLFNCDSIIISGHLPNANIADYMTKGMKMYGYNSTVYLSNDEDETTVIDIMNEDDELISEYFSCDKITGDVKKVSSLRNIK